MSQPSPLEPARQRAHSLAELGDRVAAVAMLEHAVELGKVNLGEDDPGVLAAAHQLARLHQDDDDAPAARRVLEDAYAAGQWRLGEADPLMLEISYDLGVVAEELGNRHEARKALARVVEAGAPVLGDHHWAVLKAQAYLDGDTAVLRPDAPMPAPRLRQPGKPWPPTPQQDQTPTEQHHLTPAAQREQTSAGQAEQAPAEQRHQMPAGQQEQAPAGRQHQVPVGQEEQSPVRQGELTKVEQPTPVQQVPLIYRPVEHRIPAQPVPHISAAKPAPSRSGPAIFAAIAAAAAATIAVVALVIVLAQGHDRGATEKQDVPTLGGGPAPTDVRVTDHGTSVEVTWTDPGQGKNSTIVTGGHPGEVLKPMGEVGPGETRFELRGLNDQLDYCFAVVAVYGADSFATSPQQCVARAAPQTSYR